MLLCWLSVLVQISAALRLPVGPLKLFALASLEVNEPVGLLALLRSAHLGDQLWTLLTHRFLNFAKSYDRSCEIQGHALFDNPAGLFMGGTNWRFLSPRCLRAMKARSHFWAFCFLGFDAFIQQQPILDLEVYRRGNRALLDDWDWNQRVFKRAAHGFGVIRPEAWADTTNWMTLNVSTEHLWQFIDIKSLESIDLRSASTKLIDVWTDNGTWSVVGRFDDEADYRSAFLRLLHISVIALELHARPFINGRWSSMISRAIMDRNELLYPKDDRWFEYFKRFNELERDEILGELIPFMRSQLRSTAAQNHWILKLIGRFWCVLVPDEGIPDDLLVLIEMIINDTRTNPNDIGHFLSLFLSARTPQTKPGFRCVVETLLASGRSDVWEPIFDWTEHFNNGWAIEMVPLEIRYRATLHSLRSVDQGPILELWAWREADDLEDAPVPEFHNQLNILQLEFLHRALWMTKPQIRLGFIAASPMMGKHSANRVVTKTEACHTLNNVMYSLLFYHQAAHLSHADLHIGEAYASERHGRMYVALLTMTLVWRCSFARDLWPSLDDFRTELVPLAGHPIVRLLAPAELHALLFAPSTTVIHLD